MAPTEHTPYLTALRRLTESIGRFNYALGGRDLWNEWDGKMDPADFDRRWDERRQRRQQWQDAHPHVTANLVLNVAAGALWVFIIFALVWGMMGG